MKNLVILLSVFLIPSSPLLAEPRSEQQMSCKLSLVAGDIPSGGKDWSFSAPLKGGSHGGSPMEFEASSHKATILANGQWLGISWDRKGVKVAEGVFVLDPNATAANRVAIMYDPSGSGDQISLSCDI